MIVYVHKEYVVRLAPTILDPDNSADETALRRQGVTNAAQGGEKLTRSQFLEILFQN